MMIRVAIADDHREFRLALRLLLRTFKEIELVCEASSGRGAVECVQHHRPDVLVMDVSMPEVDGFTATRQIVGLSAATRVILMTAYQDKLILKQAVAAGAHGFLPKDKLLESLLLAIKTVHEGQPFFLD